MAWTAAFMALAPAAAWAELAQNAQTATAGGAESAEHAQALPGSFEFVDGDGLLRTAGSYAPAVVAVYFGYSNCPDICPAVLAKLAAAREEAGADPASFKVLFVTIDPKRDTRVSLRQYLQLFGEGFIGARALPSELRAVAASFGAHFDAIETDRGIISISHSEDVYLLDHAGALAQVLPGEATLSEFVDTIASLVENAKAS